MDKGHTVKQVLYLAKRSSQSLDEVLPRRYSIKSISLVSSARTPSVTYFHYTILKNRYRIFFTVSYCLWMFLQRITPRIVLTL